MRPPPFSNFAKLLPVVWKRLAEILLNAKYPGVSDFSVQKHVRNMSESIQKPNFTSEVFLSIKYQNTQILSNLAGLAVFSRCKGLGLSLMLMFLPGLIALVFWMKLKSFL